MTNNPDYLFVYGTLRPLFDNSFAQFLHQHSEYVDDGAFPGLLLNLARSDTPGYPGATYQPDGITNVIGTVYDIGRYKQLVLAYLDDYEGVGAAFDQPNEYVRVVIPVRCGKAIIDCWVYLYNGNTDGWPIIVSGDYVRYSRNE